MTDQRELFLTGRDVELLQIEIETQRRLLNSFDRARTSAAESGDPAGAEDADYRYFQARRYLEELEADLAQVTASEAEAGREIFVPLPPLRETGKAGEGLAVVVGHAKTADGATGLIPPFPAEMKSEWPWNSELAQWIKDELAARQVRCEVFFRNTGGSTGVADAYRRVIAWGPRASVELHFNAANGSARGTETLYEFASSMDWARLLQQAMCNLYDHGDKRTERNIKLDRGLLQASKNGRGVASLNKFDTSALIEPFFGDNLTDATLGTSKKRELAKAIAESFVAFAASGATVAAASVPQPAAPSAAPASEPASSPAAAAAPASPAVAAAASDPSAALPLWERFRIFYAQANIEFPVLKDITYAQWGLESGHGASRLAREAMNFGGLKYRDFLKDVCVPFDYVDSGGRRDKYCKFATFENFLKGYWRRFDEMPDYKGWRNATSSGEAYLKFIANIYAPPSENDSYVAKVTRIHNDYQKRGWLPSQIAAKLAAVAAAPPAASPTTPPVSPAAPPASTVSAAAAPVAAPPTPPVPAEPAPGAATAAVATAAAAAAAASTAPGAPAAVAAAPVDLVAAVKAVAPAGAEHFLKLVAIYAAQATTPAHLKAATVAQWALESDWGRSALAAAHYNFAGMKWQDEMTGLAVSADYRRPLGGTAPYCRFLALDDFVKGYWGRLERDASLAGWQQHTATAQAFMDFILPRWNAADPGYAGKVGGLFARIFPAAAAPATPAVATAPAAPPAAPAAAATTAAAGAAAAASASSSSSPSAPTAASAATAAATTPAISAPAATLTTPRAPSVPAEPASGSGPVTAANLDGFILQVVRRRTEYREGKGFSRTVGEYQAFFNRQPVPGLQGAVYEQKGPGDNTSTGTANARRIAAGTYPLHTQAGVKYKTYGYTSGTAYPKPGLLVENTDYRKGIVIHPGSGYLSSVGCLNPSQPLSGAEGNLDFMESRDRTISLIDKMREILGDRFPSTNGHLIKDAWLVVQGEPPNQQRGVDRQRESLRESILTGDKTGRESAIETSRMLTPQQSYEILASTMNGIDLPERVSLRMFDVLAQGRNDLNVLRGADGQNLWSAWSLGWQAATAVSNLDERARQLSELRAIADRLRQSNVDLNDRSGPRTPLSGAAAANLSDAAMQLHGMGAILDLRDRLGDTPLTAAAFAGAAETAEFLVGAGANTALRTGEEAETALDIANPAFEMERPAPGSSALECVNAGRPIASSNPAQARYDRIEALLVR